MGLDLSESIIGTNHAYSNNNKTFRLTEGVSLGLDQLFVQVHHNNLLVFQHTQVQWQILVDAQQTSGKK